MTGRIGRPRPGVDGSLPSPPVTLRLAGISRAFGGRTLFSGVDLEVRAGDRIALVGANGIGKTTLLRIAAGDRAGGRRRARLLARRRAWRCCGRRSTRRARAPCRPRPRYAPSRTSTRSRRSCASWRTGCARGRTVRCQRPSPSATTRCTRASRARAASRASRGWSACSRGSASMPRRVRRPLARFSGGWLMRVELAKLLLQDPEVLLLDEPTNHLDLPSLEWFDETLASFRGGVVLVSHDRAFLRRHALRVAELAGRRLDALPRRLGFLPGRARAQARAGRGRAPRAGSQGRRDRALHRALPRQGHEGAPGAEPGQGARQARASAGAGRGRAPDAPRDPRAVARGRRAAELLGVHKAYGEQVVYRGVERPDPARREAWRWSGPNGAGKSTLLRDRSRARCPSSRASASSATRCRSPSTPSTSSTRSTRAAPCSRSSSAARRSRTSRACARTSARSCSRATT